jgi:hypothetical protein
MLHRRQIRGHQGRGSLPEAIAKVRTGEDFFSALRQISPAMKLDDRRSPQGWGTTSPWGVSARRSVATGGRVV